MGTLTNVGFLSPETGEISNSARIQFVDNVTRNIGLGNVTSILGTQFPLNYAGSEQVALIFDPQGDITTHRQKYETWHRLNIDTMLQGIADILDQVPPIGIASKLIPYFDPFQPIIDILNVIKEKIPGDFADFDILDFITQNLTTLLFDVVSLISGIVSISNDFFAGLESAKDQAISLFLDFIINNILPKTGKSQTEITTIQRKIDNLKKEESTKELILDSISALIQNIISAPEALTIPTFNIGALSFDLGVSNVGPLSSEGQNPGAIFAYTQIISNFFAGVAGIILSAGEWILKITQGLEGLLAYLVESLIDIGAQAIKSVYPEIEKSVGLVSTLIELFKSIIQMTIVTILGYLLGPGIVTLSAASLIELV
jgi:hypothetical protein